MRDNAAEYKSFLAVHPGGGVRRNPKRKNVSTYSTPEAFTPTPEDVDIAFEIRLKEMGKTTTYGDNQELVAFTRVYPYNVMVYQQHDSDKEIVDPDFMVTSNGEQNLLPIAYIAYDVCTAILLSSLIPRLTDPTEKGRALHVSPQPHWPTRGPSPDRLQPNECKASWWSKRQACRRPTISARRSPEIPVLHRRQSHY